MKKQNLKKLSLRKVRISALKKTTINGGFDDTNIFTTETCNYTACYGQPDCGLFATFGDCTGTSEFCPSDLSDFC